MSKHKKNAINYNKNPALPRSKTVRLSQCMIVKNEEKNIEKALNWAKDIAFEQIVVDTGSTDRTIAIAERMGAKVLHFEWINDFAAAKNYAIKQASGNWIAFLDADEYFSDEDAKKLMKLLLRANTDPSFRDKCLAIRCPWVQLDDKGKPFAIFDQIRIFRNLPSIKYSGRIHEALTLSGGVADNTEINIMHTGYTDSVYSDTNKGERNIILLEEELTKNPKNSNLKCYLADSLRIAGPAQDLERAEALYIEALESGEPITDSRKHSAYNYLIPINSNRGDNERAEDLCRKAVADFPDNADFNFYLGVLLCLKQNYDEAWDFLSKCEQALKNPSLSSTRAAAARPVLLFYYMLTAAGALGDRANVMRCATYLLKEDKYQKGVITPYLKELTADESTTDEEIFKLLGKLYDFNNAKDKLTLLRAAKDAGNEFIFNKVFSSFTKEELEWLTAAPQNS